MQATLAAQFGEPQSYVWFGKDGNIEIDGIRADNYSSGLHHGQLHRLHPCGYQQ